MAELDFRSASLDEIDTAFRGDNCVLLRGCFTAADIERLRHAADAVAPQGALHFSDSEMRARGLPHFCDYVFGEKHRQLLSRLLGGRYRVSRNTATRRIDSAGAGDGHQLPLPPHVDAFFHRFEWTVNFWIPFRACGRDAPSLGVVRASVAEAQAFTGYDGKRRRGRFPSRWNFANFTNTSFAVDDLRSAFGERVWTPEYALGDAMLLSNWTLHFTHFLPEMTERRSNVELRFTTRAGRGEALSDALGPMAAKSLTALRCMFPSGAATRPRSH